MFKIITTIIIILAVLMVCIAAFKTDNVKKEVYYECKDMFGNNVVCEKIYNSYGQLWGITSDGTAVQITSGRKVGDKMANLAKKLRDEEDKKQIKKLTGKTPKHRCPICHRFTLWANDGKTRKCLMCELIKKEREENANKI